MPPGGIRTRNSRVVADSQPVTGLGPTSKPQLVSGSHPASKPQPISGSHLACSHIGAVPAGPSRGPQSVVGNQTAAAKQLNQSSCRASGPHEMPGSRPAASHTVAVPAGPSRGPQYVVGNQSAIASQMNESSTGATGEAQQRKNVRKKAQNKTLKNFIESGGGKPKIEIPIGKLRPLGKWAKEWTTELGIIVRQNIPLTLHYWKQVTKEFKITLYDKVLLRFDVDMSLEHVRDAVDDSLKDRFKDRRHKLHLYYLSLADGVEKIEHPEKTITQQEWESLCAHFETEEFKRRSARNKENRKANKVNHRGGSKSFVRHRFDQRDPETGEEPDRVEFYRNMRWNNTKGWIAPEAEDNYEKMLEIRSQPVEEGGKELTDGEIVEKVLGKRSGYVIGLGRAEVPPSRKARVIYNMDEVNQLKMRTEEQDRELNELRAWKASQEELSNSQQQKIDAQQQKIDAQAKKQEETDLILIALKQKLGL